MNSNASECRHPAPPERLLLSVKGTCLRRHRASTATARLMPFSVPTAATAHPWLDSRVDRAAHHDLRED